VVVLVDDDLRVVEGLVTILRRQPYRTVGLTSPHAVLALLEKEPVDVVVSDEKMPLMNGTTLLGRIRDRFPHVSRIMLTGHADMDVAMRAFDLGDIQRFLLKPCPPPELIAAIHEGLATRLAKTG
jgi:DNA-binding NtrC family response regulator